MIEAATYSTAVVTRLPSGNLVLPQLTERQEAVLKFTIDWAEARRVWPSQREVAAHFGISQAAVYNVLGALSRKGFLTRQGRGQGNLVLTEVGTEWYRLRQEGEQAKQLSLLPTNTREQDTE